MVPLSLDHVAITSQGKIVLTELWKVRSPIVLSKEFFLDLLLSVMFYNREVDLVVLVDLSVGAVLHDRVLRVDFTLEVQNYWDWFDK